MKRIKKEIIEAMLYYENKNTENLSVTAIANKFNIDKSTLFGYINSNLSTDDLISYNGKYYLLSEKELNAVSEYISNENLTFLYIKNKYGFKNETFKGILNVLGYPSERRYRTSVKSDLFKTIKTEEDAYFLGFLLADGYINKPRCTVRVKVSENDIDVLIKLANYVGLSENLIKDEFHNVTGNRQCYLSLYRRDIVSSLEDKGIKQAKSNEEIPYLDISPSLIKHYIRGIFDGDGYILKDGWNIGFSISKEVLLFIKNHFDNNFQNGYCDSKRGIYYDDDSHIHRLRIFGKDNVLTALDYLYSDATVFLDRKYNIYKDLIKKSCRG